MTRIGTAVWIIMLTAALARANDTALNEGSAGPAPLGGTNGPESVIRMVSEALEISFGREFTEVHARFTFRSTKKAAPARQIVGFPDHGAAVKEATRRDPTGGKVRAAEEGDSTGPLENLRTLVNGQERPARLEYGWVEYRDDGFYAPVSKPGAQAVLMAWHAVEVTFPPGEDVTIERQYRAANGNNVLGMRFFRYTTATGGVWQGTIGQLSATVTLGDGLTIDDLAWEGGRNLPKMQAARGPYTSPGLPAWERLGKSKMRLVWEDFEPRTEESRRAFEICLPATRDAP